MAKRWLLVLTLAALPLLFLGLCHRSFTDNEGMYAEVGREILLTGDWLTTRVNGSVYLNKPPLLFWLTALVLKFGGLNELPRLISGLATLGTMLLLFDLGRLIWPGRSGAGAWAAAVFLTCALTSIEARILRPDSLLMFLTALTLWGVARVSRAPGSPDRLGTAAIWGGIGLGIMVKGLLGALLPVLAFVPALLLARRARDIQRYCSGWGLLLAAAIVLPWHIAVGIVNRGFWWDYIVNQHFLYFFDRKYPHDSISHPLWFAWSAFAGRLAPWVLLLPAALLSQYHQAKTENSVAGWLPLTWLGTVWLFFSVSKGRLEHYFLPAIPAAALLIGRLCDQWALGDFGFRILDFGLPATAAIRTPGTDERHPLGPPLSAQSKIQTPRGHPKSKIERWRVVPFALISLAAVFGLVATPALLRQSGALDVVPGLLLVARAAFSTVALGAGTAAALAMARRHGLALGVLVATFLCFGAIASRGMDATDPLVSARQGIDRISPALLGQSDVAYDAGEEYQLCGGLNFYLRRRLLLIKPPGFIPPTYLEGHVQELFVKPEWFWHEWRHGQRRFLLFIDPSRTGDRPPPLCQPCYEVARGGDRLIVTNLPVPD